MSFTVLILVALLETACAALLLLGWTTGKDKR